MENLKEREMNWMNLNKNQRLWIIGCNVLKCASMPLMSGLMTTRKWNKVLRQSWYRKVVLYWKQFPIEGNTSGSTSVHQPFIGLMKCLRSELWSCYLLLQCLLPLILLWKDEFWRHPAGICGKSRHWSHCFAAFVNLNFQTWLSYGGRIGCQPRYCCWHHVERRTRWHRPGRCMLSGPCIKTWRHCADGDETWRDERFARPSACPQSGAGCSHVL